MASGQRPRVNYGEKSLLMPDWRASDHLIQRRLNGPPPVDGGQMGAIGLAGVDVSQQFHSLSRPTSGLRHPLGTDLLAFQGGFQSWLSSPARLPDSRPPDPHEPDFPQSSRGSAPGHRLSSRPPAARVDTRREPGPSSPPGGGCKGPQWKAYPHPNGSSSTLPNSEDQPGNRVEPGEA